MIGIRKGSSHFFSRVMLVGGKNASLASSLCRHVSQPQMLSYSQTGIVNGSARDKLMAIMEEYRGKNYSQSIPTRFVKDIVKSADKSGDGYITKNEFQALLTNIGAPGKLTPAELDEVQAEFLGKNMYQADGVPVETVMTAMLEEMKKKKA